ncbi:hypothetical protein [Embleya sp. NBC_00896]|uniref:hypothetical protein n=1 Tax=Embleya sp. NBC_00896 TaxID=2975961 RepID=UPI002F91883C|nr:hypothetical protein OG928_36275 [Embleya sp. NBC_00896]
MTTDTSGHGSGTPGGPPATPPTTPGTPAPADPHAGARIAARATVIGAVITGLSAVLVWGLGVAFTGDEKKNEGDAKPPTAITSSATPVRPVIEPSSRSLPTSPSESPDGPAKPYPGEPMTMKLLVPGCSIRTEIDFDKTPLTRRFDTNDVAVDPGPEEGVDMIWEDCSPTSLLTRPGARAGVLPKGTKATKATCLDAANGGGLEEAIIGFGAAELGVVKGNTICALSDKGRLMAMEIVNIIEEPSSIEMKVRTIV